MERHTDDVALAAYLRLEGFTYAGLRLRPRSPGPGKRIGEFTFPVSARLEACCDRYDRGEARVEPKAFALAFRAVRDDLFAFLGSTRH